MERNCEEEASLDESRPGVPIDIRVVSSEDLGSQDFINIYAINRNHIREQSKSVIPACGFLLTGAFGLIYFIFSGKNTQAETNPIIIIILLFASIFLASSIITSIKSVQVSKSPEVLPQTKDQHQDFLLEIYDEEYKWGRISILLLGSSLILFLSIIVIISLEYLINSPINSSDVMATTPMKNIIIILPNLP